eukprot:m.123387 g.123387  ORF g.123387 m.123387 type:complete len:868 (+) comp15677_c0_seq1:308-2911(+)
MTTVALVSLFVTCIIIQAEELTLYPWLIMPQGIVGSNGELYRGFLGDGARFINSTSSNGAGWHLINVTDSLIRETNVTDPDSSWKDNIVMAASGSRLAVYSFELQVLLQLESLDPDSGFLCDVSPLFHYDIGIAPTIVALDRGIAVVEMKSIHPPFQCDITFYPWNNATGVHLPALPCTYDAHISPRTRLAAYGSAIVSLHGGSLTKLDITSLTTEDMSASQADSYRLAIAMTHEWCCVPQKQPPNNELKSCSALSLTPFFTNSTHSMQWNKTAQFDIQPLEGDCEIPAVAACSNTSRLFAYIVLSSDSAHLRVLRLSEQMLPTDYYQAPVPTVFTPTWQTYSVACNTNVAIAMMDDAMHNPQPITIRFDGVEPKKWLPYPDQSASTTLMTTPSITTQASTTTLTSSANVASSISQSLAPSTSQSETPTTSTIATSSLDSSSSTSLPWPASNTSSQSSSVQKSTPVPSSASSSSSSFSRPSTSTLQPSSTRPPSSSSSGTSSSASSSFRPTISSASTDSVVPADVSTDSSTPPPASTSSTGTPLTMLSATVNGGNQPNLALWMSVGIVVSIAVVLLAGWCWWQRYRKGQRALLYEFAELTSMHTEEDADKLTLSDNKLGLRQGHRPIQLPSISGVDSSRQEQAQLDLEVQTAVSEGDVSGLDRCILSGFDVKEAEPRLHLTILACQYTQAECLSKLLSCLDSPDDLSHDRRGYVASHWAAAVDAASCIEQLLQWDPTALVLQTTDLENCMQICAINENIKTLKVLLESKHPEVMVLLFQRYRDTPSTLAENSSQLCCPEVQGLVEEALSWVLHAGETTRDAGRRLVSRVAMRRLRRRNHPSASAQSASMGTHKPFKGNNSWDSSPDM